MRPEAYTDKTGPATYAALTGPLADQFLGYIHGEAPGTMGVAHVDKQLGPTRREHVDAIGKRLLQQQPRRGARYTRRRLPKGTWRKHLVPVGGQHRAGRICFTRLVVKRLGTNSTPPTAHVPMRIAFERERPGQYGGTWINYASGNFGDACNYFSQKPVVERGAPGLVSQQIRHHGRRDGGVVSQAVLSQLSGGSVGGLLGAKSANQWICQAQERNPIQLSPFGRATEDFHAFVDRLPGSWRTLYADSVAAQLWPQLRARQQLLQNAERVSRR